MIRKKGKDIYVNPEATKEQQKIDEVTRKVAIAVAFVGVFYFFIKLLFL
jgi:hypothetical protein